MQYASLILAIIYFAFNIWFVSPVGEFPINDDFIYTEAARCFAQQGWFSLERSIPNCFFHIVVGGFVCKLLGFSHLILRCYTLLMGLIGIVSIYLISREIGAKPQISGLLACCYAANPLLVNLSFSFMTDVPAMTLSNLFLLSVLRAMKGGTRWYFYGSVLLAAAIAIRQTSVVFGLATLALLMIPTIRQRHGWKILFAFLIIPVAAAFGIEKAMQLPQDTSPERGAFYAEILNTLFGFAKDPLQTTNVLLLKLAELMMYLALFLAPVLIWSAVAIADKSKARKQLVLPAVLAVIVLIPATMQYLQAAHYLPFTYNLWNIPTLGLDKIMHPNGQDLPDGVRLYLTLAGCLLAIWLLSLITRLALLSLRKFMQARCLRPQAPLLEGEQVKKRQPGGAGFQPAKLLSLATLALAVPVVTLMIMVRDFDRYYLLALTPAIMCTALSLRSFNVRHGVIVALAPLLLMAASSSCAQQQCMNYERARWLALDSLERRGAKPAEIDGGIAYNYTRGGPIAFDGSVPKERRGSAPQCDIRWWPIHGEKYIVSLCGLPGYDCIGVVPYWESLKLKQSAVLILREKSDLADEPDERQRVGYVEVH
jgi:hypothetical protein